jgi:ribonuclease PH
MISSPRSHKRSTTQVRPITITPNYLSFPAGSALCEFGETRVLCSVIIEDRVPIWMRQQRGQGWLTAEYSLLPGSTKERSKRERQNPSARSLEIQRFIGRSLRAVLDLNLIGERTLVVDCDVIQADGGTRTAAITGAYVALKLAIDNLMRKNKIKVNPIKDSLAAVSLGILGDTILVDLDHEEDQRVDVDMNIVMTGSGDLVEVQSSAERKPFAPRLLTDAVTLASQAIKDIFDEQNNALV